MATNSPESKSTRYARIDETCERYGISRATFQRWVKRLPDFPKPIKAGPRVRLVDWDAMDAYMAARVDGAKAGVAEDLAVTQAR
jgi:predicted DNA-binding transcriptional regulator AlpA